MTPNCGKALLLLPLLLLSLTVVTYPVKATEDFRLEQPARQARVYAAAPSGVEVTVVRVAEDEAEGGAVGTDTTTTIISTSATTSAPIQTSHVPHYYLYQSDYTDFRYFNIDELEGNVTTARYIDRLAGEEYRVIVVALISGRAINQELTIAVTQYNQHDPTLTLHEYSAEALVRAEIGTKLLTVESTDDDDEPYNKELRYFLASPDTSIHIDPFLRTPSWSPVDIDPERGEVQVRSPLQLSSSPMRLVVGVADGGSPQRYHLANLTLYVRNMSAPRGVAVSNTSDSIMNVCWFPPAYGEPQGYILTYTPTSPHRMHGMGSLNLTVEQLRRRMELHDSTNASLLEDELVTKGIKKIYRYCATVGGLARWTKYVVGMRAWLGDQVSMAAIPVTATTRSDYCAEGICGQGNCSLHQAPPGYSCSCYPGFYGYNCENYNPCVPENPCTHFGACHNASDGTYTCECLRGFYGPNCSRIDPCAAVSSNPCDNGGSCISQESGEYTCVCPHGFFGDACERLDPCVSSPCLNGATCTNITDANFTCECAPGYTGDFCQSEIDECLSSPCKRGFCVDQLADFHCRCPRGWGGKTCDEDLDECASSPCLNGATCIDGMASFVCDCAHGYSGEMCGIPESCPAQTMHLDTGEFHWPATRHGEIATLPCPYGAKSVPGEKSTTTTRTTTTTTTTTSTTTTTTTSWPTAEVYVTTTSSPVTSEMTWKITPQYRDLLRPTLDPPSEGFTTQAEWEGGSFRINRRTRSADMGQGDDDLHSTLPFKEASKNSGVRRRIITSHIRISPPRQSGTRRFRWRQQERVPRTRGMAEPEIKTKEAESGQSNNEERTHVNRRQRTFSRRNGNRGFRSQIHSQPRRLSFEHNSSSKRSFEPTHTRQVPITQTRTGERFRIENQFEDSSRKENIVSRILNEEEHNSSHADRKSRHDLPRIEESVIDQLRIQGSRQEEQRSRETANQEQSRRGSSFPEEQRIISSHSTEPRISSSQHVQTRTFSNLSELPEKRVRLTAEPRIGDRVLGESKVRDNHFEQPRIGQIIPSASRFHHNDSVGLRKASHLLKIESEALQAVKEDEYTQNKRGDTASESEIGQFERKNPLRREGLLLGHSRVSGDGFGLLKAQTSENIENPQLVTQEIEGSRQPQQSNPSEGNDDNNKRILAKVSPIAGAFRSCKLLTNGLVVWKEPDASMCRGKAMQAAEDEARELATLTSSPSNIDPSLFSETAQKLSKIVEHAVNDPVVANNMVSALSNMLEVNDSVVAAGDEEEDSVADQLVRTINTFTESVALEVGQALEIRSNNIVVAARLVDPSTNDSVTFQPKFEPVNKESASNERRKREANISDSDTTLNSYLVLPPQVLKMTNAENVRLEFVSYSNDKFFRGSRSSGKPVISARVSNTSVRNLTEPVTYYIPTEYEEKGGLMTTSCVYWDERVHDWSSEGMRTIVKDGITSCQATHLTAFSVLLDPLPSSLGVHEEALSIITYVGVALSTVGLTATVATYAVFRPLRRDRSGRIVMNLALALLLLNLVFIITSQVQPPSIACTALAAVLHYLVMAAFAWMLVEAANMYQLLITVFASSETNFIIKRFIAAWGLPGIIVMAALIADLRVYGDEDRGFCVISPNPNPVIYYTTYMGPICFVLAVNCVVFIMVTRVLCQRRPRSHKPRSSNSPIKEAPVTLAQVRGAITVVALLGVTWVAGAVSVGWARVTLQYIFCLTTPLQGLIIFIVRVAQRPEARISWITLLTTGKRLKPAQWTHTRSTHSSGHTRSTSSVQHNSLRNSSSVRTASTRASPMASLKAFPSTRSNGSLSHKKSKRRSVQKTTSSSVGSDTANSGMGTLFSRLVKRLNPISQDNHTSETLKDTCNENAISEESQNSASSTTPQNNYHEKSLRRESSIFSERFLQESYFHSNMNGALHRPQSLVLLRTDSHGMIKNDQANFTSHSYRNPPVSSLLSDTVQPQSMFDSGVPASMVPRRSLGSLLMLTNGKEGDDSSWHFIRPPPDGRSDPVSEREIPIQDSEILSCTDDKSEIDDDEGGDTNGCVVLSGQRVATNDSPMIWARKRKQVSATSRLTRAISELQMGSPHINPAELRRSASVYTLGEWEDPRSSHA